MTAYPIRSSGSMRFLATLSCLVGVGMILGVIILRLALDPGPPLPAVILVAVVGVLALVYGIIASRAICLVRLEPNGMIVLDRAFGTTRIPASTVWELEGRNPRDEDSQPVWLLVMTHAGGKAAIDRFQNVPDFVRRVQQVNPRVEVTGSWPKDTTRRS